MIQLRLRTRTHPDTLTAMAGKQPTDADYNLLLTGPARVLKPDGRPLAVYLPGELSAVLRDNPPIYDVLHSLRTLRTDDRGLASGSRRTAVPGQSRTRTRKVPSAVIGAVDPMGQQRYCRLTAWTGRNLPAYQQLRPLLLTMSQALAAHVPDRHAAQAAYVQRTERDWVVPDTVFTTVTVNNTYSTGVHTDKGDLAAGFSTLAVLRRGAYVGGRFTFPEWRVAVDMQDGDLLLMDAHDWHGNTRLFCAHGAPELEAAECCGVERISVVAYYREHIAECGDQDAETVKAVAGAERRSGWS